MSFLDELADRLVSQSVGTINVDIFTTSKSVIPDGDGPYISLTETGGSGPTRIQNQDSAATLRPTAQIAVRAESPEIARAKAKAAYDALDGIFNTTLSGTFYLSLTARQEPTDIGLDGKGRLLVTFNVEAEKYPS